MRVIFEKVRWRNLLSTGNIFTEIDLENNSSTLFVGRNGHGKSTMLDALTFGLFGKAFRKVNLAGLVNSINNKDCLVEIEFRINSRKYKIRRGLKPGIFEIYVDGDLLPQDISQNYQRYLEKNILKFNHKSFTQIVILGSKSFIPFMKLVTQDRRAIIEDLLDIQVFSNMNKITKDNYRTISNNITSNKKSIDNTTAQISMQKKYVEDSKKNNQEHIDKKKQEILDNINKISEVENEISKIETLLISLKKQFEYKKVFQDKVDQYDELITKIRINKDKAMKELVLYQDMDSCPTCKQDIDDKFRNQKFIECNNNIVEYDTALSKLENQKVKFSDGLDEAIQTGVDLNKQNSSISTHRVHIKHIQEYIEKLEREILELNSKKSLSPDMMKISRDLVESLEALTRERKILIEDRAYTEIELNLLRDDGVKAKIIKQYLPIINKWVNKYLSAMDFFVNFELDEEFEETIKSRHRDTFKYDNFSEGEKQMIDIALLFAWRSVAKLKNSMNTNLLVLDEIFDSSMDTVGADMLLGILNAMPQDSNIFIISHRELLHDKFNNTIRFEKHNNFSTITT